ncbi:alpha-2-macroglobulin [Kalamiella sp. sgz302252]|uniref:alpha-2-macroglobulin family protein n=1 Tax=Pantoea sp. sgz302252 TaxID=3341827 RepID=UPI0036D43CA1
MTYTTRAFGLAVLLSLLTLSGCDNNEKEELGLAAHSAAKATQPQPAPAPLSEAAIKRDAGKPLKLIDASEVQLDGAATLVLTFSVALDDRQNYSSLLHLVDSKTGAVEGGWELSPNRKELRFRHLPPDRELTVTLDSGLLAANGVALAEPVQQKITTRDIQPMVGFASRGSLLPTRITQGLPVLALNINKVDVDFFRVKPASLPAFLSSWQYGSSLSTWRSRELQNKTELVYSGRFELNPQRNTREKMLLPLNDIAALKQPGVYLAVMKQAGSYNYSNPATLFTLSDIGLSLHQFPGKLAVFAQSLEDGAAQPNTQLTLLDQKGRTLEQATTDKNGYAELAANEQGKLLLATQGEQTTLLDLTLPALDLAEFAVTGPEGYDKQLFMFSPRDLYRPGETVVFNALMRDADGAPLPPQPVKATVVKPDGEAARTFVWQPENGLYQYRYALPESAATGKWTLRLDTGDGRARNWAFNVEDFLPERMALSLKSSEHPIDNSENASFQINGRYLYGAPAAGNTLQGQLFLRPLREAVASLPGYQFGDITEPDLKRSLDDLDLKLDEQGNASVEAESSWAETHSPLSVILQASLLEAGGRPVSRRAQQAVWPAEALPGIRPLFGNKEMYDYRSDSYRSQPMVDSDSVASFDVVYANSEGEKLAVEDLDVRLIRERRDYYWSFSDDEGWQSRYDQKDLVEDEQSIAIAAGGTARVDYPVDWGSYRLEVRAPEGNIVSSIRFWAGYSWQDNTGGSGALRPDQVKLSINKPAYQAGDKAIVHVTAPAAGKGYLMVESSNGPLWRQEITVPAEGKDIELPIDPAWKRHDLYLSALVIRQGDKSKGITPKRAVGLLHLPLAQENRRLNITLLSPDRIRPEHTLKIRVKAATKDGKVPQQVQVLLSAVDSGVLSITDYKTPDPWEAFFGRKRYNADQYDVYGQLIEGAGRLATLSYGGDGDEEDPLARGGKKPVTHANIIAQQLQPVTLDDKGEGTLELAIPEFNGELRLMAQAWSEKEFGSTEKKVVVAAPLVSELATPRFMAGGDSARLAFDVTNLTGAPQNLLVKAKASGLIQLENAEPLALALAAGERKTLFIPVSARPGFGEGEVATEITGLNLPGETVEPLNQNWKIGVRSPYPAETRSFSSVMQTGKAWNLPAEAFSGLAPSTMQGHLVLSNRLPFNIARYISELYAYPYGCLEQTTSGLYPSLFTNQMQLKALGIKGSTDAARRESIGIGIDRLAGMQRGNGGFGLWSKESPEEFWLTAYVTDFLIRAGEQGYDVAKPVIDKANTRLLRYLQDPSQIDVYYSQNANAARFGVQSYAALVLARQQKAPLGALRALYDKKDQAKSGLALVQLGVALKLMGDESRSEKALAQGLTTSRARENVWLEDYGSDIRDRAMILVLLAENQLLPEARNQLLIELSQQVNSMLWFSTQENNALFLVAHQFINDKAMPWQVQLNGQQALSGDKPLNTSVAAEQLAEGIAIQNQGEGAVYGRLDVSGYPVQSPQPAHQVLQISRRYLDLSGKEISLANLKSGDLVLVSLEVWADRQVPDALVTDLLPAGLELENQNLADSTVSLSDSAAAVQELMGDMQQASIKHMEFRDDRFVAAMEVDDYRPVTLLYLARAVTPGHYQVPPPQVESMYVPQWRAVGSTPNGLTVH